MSLICKCEAEESQRALDRLEELRESIKITKEEHEKLSKKLWRLEREFSNLSKEASKNSLIVEKYKIQQEQQEEDRKFGRYAEKCRRFILDYDDYIDSGLIPHNVKENFDKYEGIEDDNELEEFLDNLKDEEAIALAHAIHLCNIPYLSSSFRKGEEFRGIEDTGPWTDWLEGRYVIDDDLVGEENVVVFRISLNGQEIEDDVFRYDCLTMDNLYDFSIKTNSEDLIVDQIDTHGYY